MTHLFHRNTINSDQSSPMGSRSEILSGSDSLQPNATAMQVSGGRGELHVSHDRRKQRPFTHPTFNWQHPVSSTSSMARNSARKSHIHRSAVDRSAAAKSSLPAHRSESESDDNELSDSENSSQAAVTDTGTEEELDEASLGSEDAIDSSQTQSSTEAPTESSDSESELNSQEDEEDASDIGSESVFENTHHLRLRPLSNSAGSDQLKMKQSCSTLSKQQHATETRIIYLRVSPATSKDMQRKLLRQLRTDHPDVLVVLDDSHTKTPFSERTSFCLLWQWIQDGRIDCLWIAHMSHICKSKEAFQLFEWMCEEYSVRMHVQPALELAIKKMRASE